jgi:hypothetical protein
MRNRNGAFKRAFLLILKRRTPVANVGSSQVGTFPAIKVFLSKLSESGSRFAVAQSVLRSSEQNECSMAWTPA